MIVADTGAVLALLDQADVHHEALLKVFSAAPANGFVLPWSILPEVDYLLEREAGRKTADLFIHDLAQGHFRVEWGGPADLGRARAITAQYSDLKLGLVDSVVMAVAERLGAQAVATLDYRHFGAVRLKGNPALLPRDLETPPPPRRVPK